jgi:hypothetical protein
MISLKESTGVCVEEGSSRVASTGLESKSEKEHLVISRNPRGGGIDGQDSQRKLRSPVSPLDLRRVAQGLSPKEQRKTPEIRSSGYRGFRGRGTLVERNRDPRFPERSSTIDFSGDTWQGIPRIVNRRVGIPETGALYVESRFAISRHSQSR